MGVRCAFVAGDLAHFVHVYEMSSQRLPCLLLSPNFGILQIVQVESVGAWPEARRIPQTNLKFIHTLALNHVHPWTVLCKRVRIQRNFPKADIKLRA
jgi:hypothetical protein